MESSTNSRVNSHNKILVIAILCLLILSLPLAIILLQKDQDIRQHAQLVTPANVVIVPEQCVGGPADAIGQISGSVYEEITSTSPRRPLAGWTVKRYAVVAPTPSTTIIPTNTTVPPTVTSIPPTPTQTPTPAPTAKPVTAACTGTNVQYLCISGIGNCDTSNYQRLFQMPQDRLTGKTVPDYMGNTLGTRQSINPTEPFCKDAVYWKRCDCPAPANSQSAQTVSNQPLMSQAADIPSDMVVVETATTDELGHYTFDKLCKNSTTVIKTDAQPGWLQILPPNDGNYSINITDNTPITGKDFNFIPAPAPTCSPFNPDEPQAKLIVAVESPTYDWKVDDPKYGTDQLINDTFTQYKGQTFKDNKNPYGIELYKCGGIDANGNPILRNDGNPVDINAKRAHDICIPRKDAAGIWPDSIKPNSVNVTCKLAQFLNDGPDQGADSANSKKQVCSTVIGQPATNPFFDQTVDLDYRSSMTENNRGIVLAGRKDPDNAECNDLPDQLDDPTTLTAKQLSCYLYFDDMAKIKVWKIGDEANSLVVTVSQKDSTQTHPAPIPYIDISDMFKQISAKYRLNNPDATGEGKYQIQIQLFDTTGNTYGGSNIWLVWKGATNQCTATPTPPPFTPPVSPPAGTGMTFNVFLHGIGNSGDNRNPSSELSNKNPLHPQRDLSMEIYDQQNNLVATKLVGTQMTYINDGGYFKGTAVFYPLVSGSYLVKIKTNQYLKNVFAGIQNIKGGSMNFLPNISLVAGDVNNDNQLDIFDYNMLYGCYTSPLSPTARNCDESRNKAADINDDGSVNEFDINLFIRELSVQPGV